MDLHLHSCESGQDDRDGEGAQQCRRHSGGQAPVQRRWLPQQHRPEAVAPGGLNEGMMTKLAIAAAALVFTFAGPGLADEDSIELKPSEGAEVVEQNCATCHSLDYLEMNSVF